MQKTPHTFIRNTYLRRNNPYTRRRVNFKTSALHLLPLQVCTCRDLTTSNVDALKDFVSSNRLSIPIKIVESGQCLLGNNLWYICSARHAFPCAWPYIKRMSAYFVFANSDMIIAHSLKTLVTNAKLAEDCMLYISFLATICRGYFFLTTMNLHGGNALVAVFALRQGDSCTICDSLHQTE